MNGDAGLGFTRHTRTVGSAAKEQVESSGAARPLNAGRTGRMGAGARADLSSVCSGHLSCERTGPEVGEPTPKGNTPFVCVLIRAINVAARKWLTHLSRRSLTKP